MFTFVYGPCALAIWNNVTSKYIYIKLCDVHKHVTQPKILDKKYNYFIRASDCWILI